jgi:hypothetical protein
MRDKQDHRDGTWRSSGQGSRRQGRRLEWLEAKLLNTDDLALAVRVLAVRAGVRRRLGPPRITAERLNWQVSRYG